MKYDKVYVIQNFQYLKWNTIKKKKKKKQGLYDKPLSNNLTHNSAMN